MPATAPTPVAANTIRTIPHQGMMPPLTQCHARMQPPGPFEVGHSPRKAGVYEAVYKSEKNKQIKIYNNSYGSEVYSFKL